MKASTETPEAESDEGSPGREDLSAAEGPPVAATPGGWPSVQMPVDQLLKTLEVELIPRLLVSHMAGESASPVDRDIMLGPGSWSSAASIDAFSRWCVEQDTDAISRHVSRLLAADVGLDSIYLYLLSPVARQLGQQWTDDELTFVDVSLGLCSLHRLLCDCESVGFRHPVGNTDLSILLAATPGDQHTFGIAMAADFYRRYGWQVSNLSGSGVDELLDMLESTHFSAFGLSLHNEDNYDMLCRVIRRARKRTVNPDLVIIVGGNYFATKPESVERCGADLFAVDGHKAVLDTKATLQRGVRTA